MSARRKRNQRRRRQRGVGRMFFLAGVIALCTTAIGAMSIVGYVVSIAASAPPISSLKPADPGASSVIYAADGRRLGFIESDILRTPVAEKKIPQYLRNATVAIEDRRFYAHKGVDAEGVVRAAIKNLRSGKTVQGGSTLTMQLIRALYISPERTFKRKIREAKLAQELEKAHPGKRGKEWILTQYLNVVPYGTNGGQTAIGVEAASRVYFNKTASKLNLQECALLAGLPQAPSEYNPLKSRAKARQRRAEVLDAMASQGMISPLQAAKAKRSSLGVEKNDYYSKRQEGYVFEYVKRELVKKYGQKRVRQGGLKVYTTIEPRLQQAARTAMHGILPYPDDPQSAIVSIDPSNGQIRAMASSTNYGEAKFDPATQGHRQPGSTAKIWGLVAAVRRGISPESTYYTSKKLNLNDPLYGHVDVSTYDDTYGGSMNLVQATLKSDNSVYTQLGLDIGPPAVVRAAKDMGIRTKLDAYPATILGGLRRGVTPLEQADAYATIASGGWRSRPVIVTKVVFPKGKVDRSLGDPHRIKKFDDGVMAEVRRILEKNIQGGTGQGAAIGCPAGGKTGTTDNFRDAWFAGFTPRLTTVTWVGYVKSQIPMLSVHGISVNGGSFPASIWQRYMSVAKGSFCGDFLPPKTPFVSSPFFGHYASTGKADKSSEDGKSTFTTPTGTPDTQTNTTGTTTGTSTDNGDGTGPR